MKVVFEDYHRKSGGQELLNQKVGNVLAYKEGSARLR